MTITGQITGQHNIRRLVAVGLTVGTLAAGAVSGTAGTAAAAGSQLRAVLVQRGGVNDIVIVTDGGREVGRIKKVGDINAVSDVAVAPDGTVAAVVTKRHSGLPDYDTALVVYDKNLRTSTTIVQYATSVAWSPDGKRLAYTVVSPDGDGDGYGLAAVRTISRKGGTPTTLHSFRFPVTRTDGWPAVETGGQRVQAWNGGRIVLAWGCCGDANTTLLSGTKKTNTLKSVKAWPIGQNPAGAVLVRADRWGASGSTYLGVRYSRLSTTGTLTTLKDAGPEGDAAVIDQQVADAKGYRLYDPRPEDVRYQGPGTVVKTL